MILRSFADELVKISAVRVLLKKAEDESASSVNAADPPTAIMGGGAVPTSLRVSPDRAATRLPNSVDFDSQIEAGSLGEVTSAKAPIDRDKHNRWYRDKK